jgi:hypothetical protein
MDSNFDTVAPIAFFYERNTERSHVISRELRKFYLRDQPLTNASLSSLGEVSSTVKLLKHLVSRYEVDLVVLPFTFIHEVLSLNQLRH